MTRFLVFIMLLFFGLDGIKAQFGPCDASVPEIIVDLSSSPDSAWFMSSVIRDGTCCSYGSPPNQCVTFALTLHPDAQGIIFDVTCGALPSNLEWQLMDATQTSCDTTMNPAGVPVCLDGAGPHYIVFCKPGGNDNCYEITSVPEPSISPPQIVNDGCTGVISTSGFDPSTIQVNSIAPGAPGDYNYYLDCAYGCDSINVSAQLNFPPFIDFEVCGIPVGACQTTTTCDTTRISFVSALVAEIQPLADTVCYGATGGVFSVVASGGTPPYTYLWGNGATTQSINVSTSGSYTVAITDQTNCFPAEDSVYVNILTQQISANAGPDQLVCSGEGAVLAGSVTTASGGVWSGGFGTYSVDSTDLTATYDPGPNEILFGAADLILTTTGNLGCPAESDTVHIDYSLLTSTIIDQSMVDCFGGASGYAEISALTGFSPYTYSWDTSPVQTTAMATGLPAGFYCGTVTDSLGCVSTSCITITEPPLIDMSISAIADATCFGVCDGSSIVLATGGVPPYNFTWSNGGTGPIEGNLCAGSYIAVVNDIFGCLDSVTVVVAQPDSLILTLDYVTNVSCFGQCNGGASVSASGGTTPYSYSWTPTANDSIVSNLCMGSYTAYVQDSNGCDITLPVTITQPIPLMVTLDTLINVSCFGGNDGIIGVDIFGGTAPYTVSWNTTPPQGTPTAIGLPSGVYTATVTDANGCVATYIGVINEPTQLTLSIIDSTDVSCFGGSDGSAIATVSGGTPLYSYSWSSVPAQNSVFLTNVSAGSYTLLVTDANNCAVASTVTIEEPPILTLSTVSITNISCSGFSDGEAEVLATGGTPGYIYTWDTNPVQSSENLVGVPVGNYVANVEDVNGCIENLIISIIEPTPIVLSTSFINANCGNNDGSATVVAVGGTPSYDYSWGVVPPQSNATAINLGVGNYNVTVTDQNSCSEVATVTISDIVVSASVDSVGNVSCNGLSDGWAEVSGTGGTLPYSYTWNSVPVQTDSLATGLPAGTYTATIIDNNGCQGSVVMTVIEPFPIINSFTSTNVSCFGGANGIATVIPSGQYPPYSYTWNTIPVQNTQTATGLQAGTYNVTVSDAIGCDTTGVIVITEPTVLVASIPTAVDATCFGYNNGSAIASASGGTIPYTYSWNTFPVQNSQNLSNVNAGNYTVTVTDLNSCLATMLITINEPTPVTVTYTGSNNVLCNGESNGGASVTAMGGTPTYSYFWNTVPVQFGSSLSALTAGTYITTAVDANGCFGQDTITITEPPILVSIFDSVVNVSCFGGNDGQIYTTTGGGTSPYNYVWNSTPVQTNPIAIGLPAGTFTVDVTDQNGCQNIISAVIQEPSVLSAQFLNTSSPQCFGNDDGYASVTGVNGTPPYIYQWSTVPVQTNPFAIGLTAGNYNVLIGDANGCSTTLPLTLTDNPQLQISASSVDVDCFGDNDGIASASAVGGVGSYTYLWMSSPPQTSQIVSNLIAGSYTVVVNDSLGCADTTAITISQPTELVASVPVINNVSCGGGANGMAFGTATGGVPVYTYQWNTTPVSNSDIITNLSVGTYILTVTDANFCIDTVSVSITEPDSIGAEIVSLQNISCFGLTDGTIEATGIGGTLPYTYQWNTIPVQTDSIISNLAAGAYTVVIIDALGCTAIRDTTITEPPSLNLTLSIDSVSCFGFDDGAVSANAFGGTPPYSYLWNTAPIAQVSPDAIWLGPGNYSVLVTDSTGCTASGFATVFEPAPLTVTADSIQNVLCAGDSSGIGYASISGGVQSYIFYWNDGQTTTTGVSFPANFYTLYVTDNNGCEDYVSIEITEPDTLIANLLYSIDETCVGAANGSAAVHVEGGTPVYSYNWNSVPAQNDTLATGLVAGNYTFTVQDANGCIETVSVFIDTDTLDATSFSMALTDSLICIGDSSELSVTTVLPSNGYTIQWSSGVGTGTGPFYVSPTAPTWYYVTVQDSCLNSYTDSVLIDISPFPIVDLTPFDTAGCPEFSITFFDTNYVSGNTYEWLIDNQIVSTDSLFDYTFTFNEEGSNNVAVVVTSSEGCVTFEDGPGLVEVYPTPTAVIVTDPPFVSEYNPYIDFSAGGTGATSWSWSFGDGTTAADSSIRHTYPASGEYTVQLSVENDYGCTDVVSQDVNVNPEWSVYIPNSFTPNGDGNNDVFYPDGNGIDWTNYEMHIYNRWGEEIYYSFKIEVPWEGVTYLRSVEEGVEAQIDVYVYKIKVTDAIEGKEHWFLGHVSLLR